MGNVVICTHWLDGDVIPFVRIGKALKERGHDVTVLTHCYFEKLVREAGLEFEPWDTPEEYAELVEEMNSDSLGQDKTKLIDEMKPIDEDNYRKKHEGFQVRMKEYQKVLKHCKRKDTVILCKNRSSVAAHLVAEKYKLPLASAMMNPTEVISMITYNKFYAKDDIKLLNEIRRGVDLPPIKSWLQWESSPKMTLAFWPEWYAEIDKQWPKTIEAIGFPIEDGKEAVKKEVPEDFKEWLVDHPKPLLISGGTTKLINALFYPSSVQGCGLTGRPTIVLTRYRELLPKELPENVKWYEYLPLDEVLPQIGLIIHHGGMGTLSGALKAGVPQLILPCFVDRPNNAELIKALGVGNYLTTSKWQPENIANIIGQLQTPEVIEKCKEYAFKMKENNGITKGADKVEELMKDDSYIYVLNSENEFEGYEDESIKQKQKQEKIAMLTKLSDKQRAQILGRLKK
ncbi:glycosyltransferase [Cellulosilyticum ruminicola]|uniref:glycosyltransferase n=1 Tax=Cellulosilyticum ruminicola TaxID=425254 RepID=UPI0006CF6B3B|nr:glycosyltransferase [Cellulosilyticum ruminicola]